MPGHTEGKFQDNNRIFHDNNTDNSYKDDPEFSRTRMNPATEVCDLLLPTCSHE